MPDAIEEIGGILADEDLLAIRFDSQMGTRTAAVRQLLSRRIAQQVGGSAADSRRPGLFFDRTVRCVQLDHVPALEGCAGLSKDAAGFQRRAAGGIDLVDLDGEYRG